MAKRRLYPFLLLLLLMIISLSAYGHSCAHPPGDVPTDYRQAMREFVQGISLYARGIDSSFIIIPQNGHELLTEDGAPAMGYIAAIDGIGREDLFYGYDADNRPTPSEITQQWLPFMDLAETRGLSVLVTDYCTDRAFVDDSYVRSAERGYISFAADRRELDDVPAYPAVPTGENSDDIALLADARNFLYLINPVGFPNKQAFLEGIRDTNYDVVLIDLFDYDGVVLSREGVDSLRAKRNGGRRLVIAYMSIGEAEDYRYYWEPAWSVNPPSWLETENANWEGNFKVRYWDSDWQRIIFGNDYSYLKKIIDAGFNGVYLDIIDAFEYFENRD